MKPKSKEDEDMVDEELESGSDEEVSSFEEDDGENPGGRKKKNG